MLSDTELDIILVAVTYRDDGQYKQKYDYSQIFSTKPDTFATTV